MAQNDVIHALIPDTPNWKLVRFNSDDSSEVEITIRNSGVLDGAVSLPYGLAVAGNGSYYISGLASDEQSRAVWRLDPDGSLRQVLSLPRASATDFMQMADLCTDNAGNLYVAQGSSVLKMTPDGVVTTVAGTGQAGYSGDNGPATAAQLNGAAGIAIDSSGNMFLADTFNRRIRMVARDGVIRTIAVTGPLQEANDVLYGGAWLDAPSKIAVDARGNVYFTEMASGLVRKLTPNAPLRLTVSSGDAQQAAGGSALPSPLTVNLMGQAGTPVEGALVTWKVSSGTAFPTATTSITDSTGMARIAVTMGADPGPVTITATVANLPTVQFTATATGPSTGADGTVTLPARSGNGSTGGRDGVVTFLLGPSVGDFDHALTSADLSSARTGPPAYIVSPNPAWTASLSEDPLARWIGTKPDAANSGTTALYATSFTISRAFGAATITIHYASDDGPSNLGGILLNGTVICQNQVETGFSQEHTLKCDVGPLLNVGKNWLYFHIVNAVESGSGLLFSVVITTAPAAAPTISAVVGAGGSIPPVTRISPGGLATVYGANFAPPGTSRQVQAGDLVDGSLPAQLAGVCVSFNAGAKSVGSGGLTYVGPAQVNFQVPSLPLNADLSVQVSVNCGTASVQTATQNVTTDEASPEFLYWVKNADGRNPVIAVNSMTGAYVGRTGLISGASFTPAKPGDYLTIYGISFGPTTPTVSPGSAPSGTAATTNAPAVTLGTAVVDSANVLYTGVSPGTAGLYQLNIQVPAGLADGDYPITMRLGANATPSGGYITVRNVQVNDSSFEQLTVPSGGWGIQPNQGSSPSFSFPSGYAGWSFSGNSGVTLKGTAFSPPNNFPDGLKVALLQGNGTAVSQDITGLIPSVTYTVSLYVGTRNDGGTYDGNTSVNVAIDGVSIGTTGLLPSSSPFARYSFTFTVRTAGSHSLSISNAGPKGDQTAFIDSVSITDMFEP